MPYAWQVRRSELDEILFRNAAASGAGHAGRLPRAPGALRRRRRRREAVLDDGADAPLARAFVVDASGRDTLLANQFGSKQRNPRHNSAALFGHFRGARRLEGQLEGNISIFWFQHGWFWFIPLADGTTSVGATCWPHYLKTRDKPLAEFFADTIAMSPGWPSGCATRNWSTTACTPPATTATAARAARAIATCCWATPTPSSTRCSRRACTWR
jgi:flavin-dependent dehydrogenase